MVTSPAGRRAAARASRRDSTDGYADVADLEVAAASPDWRRGPAVHDADTVGSEGWWIRRLLTRHAARRPLHTMLWNYYEGRHPLPWVHDLELIAQFNRLQRLSRTNYLALVLEATEERLDVEGFRFGDAAEADPAVWDQVWQPNDLDELSSLAHIAGLVTGTSYALVWPSVDDGPGPPDVWIEDADQVVHEWDTGRSRGRDVAAAVKVYHDPSQGRDVAELYLPDGLHRWYLDPSGAAGDPMWAPLTDMGDELPQYVPLPREFAVVAGDDGLVPVVPISARLNRHRYGRSELVEAIPPQDRFNQTTFDRLVGQSYSSFQQVVATGVEPQYDPETNERIPQFTRRPGRVWELGDGAAVDTIEPQRLDGLLDAAEADLNAIARLSRTPPHYLSAKAQFPSGDAIRSAEAGLVKKAGRRTRTLSGSWEHVVRLGCAAHGGELARLFAVQSIETMWADVEIRTEGERVDALVKMRSLGVPLEVLWRRWGMSVTEVSRYRQLLNADRLVSAMAPARPQLAAAGDGLPAGEDPAPL